MDTVCLKPFYHRGQESIAINFKNDTSLNLIVRKLPSVKWSQTNRCWYIPLNGVGEPVDGNGIQEWKILESDFQF
jgi:hypothetical protein